MECAEKVSTYFKPADRFTSLSDRSQDFYFYFVLEETLKCSVRLNRKRWPNSQRTNERYRFVDQGESVLQQFQYNNSNDDHYYRLINNRSQDDRFISGDVLFLIITVRWCFFCYHGNQSRNTINMCWPFHTPQPVLSNSIISFLTGITRGYTRLVLRSLVPRIVF